MGSPRFYVMVAGQAARGRRLFVGPFPSRHRAEREMGLAASDEGSQVVLRGCNAPNAQEIVSVHGTVSHTVAVRRFGLTESRLLGARVPRTSRELYLAIKREEE